MEARCQHFKRYDRFQEIVRGVSDPVEKNIQNSISGAAVQIVVGKGERGINFSANVESEVILRGGKLTGSINK